MFHVGGGIDVLNISDKKATLSGIFVSTGAMGIFLGGKSVSIGFNKYYIVILILLISAILLLWLYNQIKIWFIFSFTNPIIGIIAILLFNMTMPITLICLSNILYNNKGLAFGLLTLALFVGAVPTFIGYNQLFTKIGLFIITLISSIILYIALRYYDKSIKFKERRVKNEEY